MKHISEQLVGLAVAFVIVSLLVVTMLVLSGKDAARERQLEARERVQRAEDSLRMALLERDSMRAVWAQQKHERDSLRPIWEAQRIARERQHAAWAAEKVQREAAREAERNIEIVLQPFDPNTADSLTLVHLGLRPWMARSVVHYREKGGRYRKAEDFSHAYGMTDSLFQVLKPYITIADSVGNSGPAVRFVQKKDTILELNLTDTAELQLLRGIGKYTANQIIRYRTSLGGFVTPEQLREITPAIRDVDSILPHFTATASLVKKLYINRLSVDALQRHKYVTFEQAKAIRDYRHRRGPVRTEEVLRSLKEAGRPVFSEADIARLRPYVSYEE